MTSKELLQPSLPQHVPWIKEQDNNAGMTNDESSAAVAAATPGGQLLGAQETAGLNFPNKSKLNFQILGQDIWDILG